MLRLGETNCALVRLDAPLAVNVTEKASMAATGSATSHRTRNRSRDLRDTKGRTPLLLDTCRGGSTPPQCPIRALRPVGLGRAKKHPPTIGESCKARLAFRLGRLQQVSDADLLGQ